MTAKKPALGADAAWQAIVDATGQEPDVMVVAYRDQIMREAETHAIQGGLIAGALVCLAILAVILALAAARRLRRLVLDRQFKAAFRRMEARREEQALGIGGNP